MASVLDPSDKTYETINLFIRNVINTGTIKPSTRNYLIHQDILYGPKNEGGPYFFDARSFFFSLTISWVNKYASDKLDDHWADIIDKKV